MFCFRYTVIQKDCTVHSTVMEHEDIRNWEFCYVSRLQNNWWDSWLKFNNKKCFYKLYPIEEITYYTTKWNQLKHIKPKRKLSKIFLLAKEIFSILTAIHFIFPQYTMSMWIKFAIFKWQENKETLIALSKNVK